MFGIIIFFRSGIIKTRGHWAFKTKNPQLINDIKNALKALGSLSVKRSLV
jgi:hypothetical protein